MEAREILVMNSNTQTKNKVVTDATTLGELKAALDAEGISYTNMTFTEGISGTQFVNDDSLLPTNVMFKGSPTNNLVIPVKEIILRRIFSLVVKLRTERWCMKSSRIWVLILKN